jgi:hypothetical protein
MRENSPVRPPGLLKIQGSGFLLSCGQTLASRNVLGAQVKTPQFLRQADLKLHRHS